MFARTPRLFLRPGWQDDAEAIAAALGDRDVTRTLARVPATYGVDDARAWLSPDRPRDPMAPELLIFSRTNAAPRLIGSCGLVREDGTGDIALGYWIARPFWGLGFATEAGRAMVGIARALGHKRLVASHHVDNPASGRVLRKLGFRTAGQVSHRPSVARGEAVPSLNYELAEAEAEVAPAMRPTLHQTLYTDLASLAA